MIHALGKELSVFGCVHISIYLFVMIFCIGFRQVTSSFFKKRPRTARTFGGERRKGRARVDR